MKMIVETPPNLTGSPEHQLRVVYSYLFRLSENLNVALGDLNAIGSASYAGAQGVRSVNDGTGQSGGSADTLKAYNELRALVVNTAEIIRSEMEMLQVQLGSEYSALSSQWGAYQESVESKIVATANDIIQNLNFQSQLDALSGEFAKYQIETAGFIKSGFIDYDENSVPVIGVAIGQNLKSVTVTMPDGTALEQLDPTQNCAFYTADRLYFRVNGQEIAYLSNSKLYIRNAEITGKAVMGGKWELSSHNGFMIKWIGG